MTDAVGKLAAYFANQVPLAAADMVRLAAEARGSGLRWAAIVAACSPLAAGAPGEEGDGSAASASATRIFRDIQHAAGVVAGGAHLAPLAWPCGDCGRQVTDVAPLGRPVHVEVGHGQGCPRLARDQAGDDEDRRTRVPSLVAWSESPGGPLQRHRLSRRFTDWCPRCGWHGYFDGWAATVRGDWARLICDDCWADLSQDVDVTVTYYTCTARPGGPGAGEPFGVIRQRARSDRASPDAGQILTWEPYWAWTPILDAAARGDAGCDVRHVSRASAGQVIQSAIRRHWPQEALGLPWVADAYPDDKLTWPQDPAGGQPGPGPALQLTFARELTRRHAPGRATRPAASGAAPPPRACGSGPRGGRGAR